MPLDCIYLGYLPQKYRRHRETLGERCAQRDELRVVVVTAPLHGMRCAEERAQLATRERAWRKVDELLREVEKTRPVPGSVK